MNNDKSKVVILSGFHPTPNNVNGGIFAQIRYAELIIQEISAELYSYTNIYSKFVKRLYLYLTNKTLVNIDNYYLPQPFNEIRIKSGLFSILLSRIIPGVYYSRIADFLWKKQETPTSILHAHVVYPHGYVATILAKKNTTFHVSSQPMDRTSTPSQEKIALSKNTL